MLAAAAVAAVAFAAGGQSGTRSSRSVRLNRFAYLAAQRSNRCDLQARAILSYPDSRRPQGSCCERMDRPSYMWQRRQLRRYRGIAQIPSEPYDIPARLAKQLLRLDSSISLSPQQGGVYARAMKMTSEHGPCCCRCWRWNAVEGLARYLIATRRWQAGELAHLVDALNGCGGRSHALGSSARS